jgi:hypothetical protein
MLFCPLAVITIVSRRYLAMIKDDTKDQISLFDLGQPDAGHAPAEKQKEELPKQEPQERKKVKKPPLGAFQPSASKPARGAHGKTSARPAATARTVKSAPGPVPEGDVRLTANIREELHLKLKIAAATRRTTIGELIEELVEQYL